MPPELTTGWDVGGAHLKVAQIDAAGRVHLVRQLPCTLWRGIAHLKRAIAAALTSLAPTRRHGITMTGELTDLFADRTEGVTRITQTMQESLVEAELRIYAGTDGFVPGANAKRCARQIASANWHASARFVAARCGAGLLVDIGSTTTDLVPFADGVVRARGSTDAERLACAELRYTGVTRTPVMAMASVVPLDGRMQPVMAELFATAGDVHRLTGALPDDVDQHSTADGRGYGAAESAVRLARMLGYDASEREAATWRAIAQYLTEQQLRFIQEGAESVLSKSDMDDTAPVIGAGIGRFLVQTLAQRLGRRYIDFATLVDGTEETREWAARCAPAVAVAALLAD